MNSNKLVIKVETEFKYFYSYNKENKAVFVGIKEDAKLYDDPGDLGDDEDGSKLRSANYELWYDIKYLVSEGFKIELEAMEDS